LLCDRVPAIFSAITGLPNERDPLSLISFLFIP
jgi:hypothetical protein